MSTKSANQPPEGTSYTRGMQLGEVDTGRVIGIFLAACLVALIVLTAVLTISVTRQNARADKLHNQGVPVVATVTGCEGVGASINVGVEYWVCRGTYSLDANVYNEVIGGNRRPAGHRHQGGRGCGTWQPVSAGHGRVGGQNRVEMDVLRDFDRPCGGDRGIDYRVRGMDHLEAPGFPTCERLMRALPSRHEEGHRPGRPRRSRCLRRPEAP